MNKFYFRNTLSIKKKMMWVTSVAVGFSLFWVLILFITLNSENEWSKLNTRLTIQAEIIANNSMLTVVFDDSSAAKEILTALQADRSIINAKIITNTGAVLAYFESPQAKNNNQFSKVPITLSKWLRKSMLVEHDINFEGNKIAVVQISAGLFDLYSNNLEYVSIAFIASLLSMLITLLLSNVLLKRVIAPVIKLTKTARQVTTLQNYAVRAEILSKDEVGELTRSFNEMLDEIQRKDLFLEKIVAERTSELIQLNKKLQHQAYHDPLTGLANRMLFDDRLQMVLIHAQRIAGKFALMYFDLDHFKTVNDTLGHDTGDELLVAVTRRMKAIIREDDMLCRIGGDEFTLILNNIESIADVELVAQKMLSVFSEPFFCNEHELSISSSIGISLYPQHSRSKDQLKQFADIAMYYSKQSGRNDYCFFIEKMHSENLQRMDSRVVIKKSLKTAIENNELQIYYQPQVDMHRRIVALEALIRWKDAENKMISPSIFIPLAEESGLIQTLEEWAFIEICQHYMKWRNTGLPDVKISINISGYRLRQQHFNHFIETTLENLGVSPSFLIFEISEQEIMQNLIETEKVLNQLHDIGVKIAVDKFGSGYTSLNYLQQLPIDEFKIDSQLILLLDSKYNESSIVQAIVALANSLNKSVVAMGVEKEAQAVYLKQLNCHAMQGYLFAKPMEEKDISRVLAGTLSLSEDIEIMDLR
ncbi:MAG: EAL domain-containing protein [Methylococcaceae bacterium]